MTATERWLGGPVDGIDPSLQPVAHALLQTADDVARAVDGLSRQELEATPGGIASLAFHLRHLVGSTDRLFTYARGEALTPAQRDALRAESHPVSPPEAGELVEGVRRAVEAALAQLRTTSPAALLDAREVGRQKMPSNVIGLLFHAAEHAQRHAGQVVTTARMIRAAKSEGVATRHAD